MLRATYNLSLGVVDIKISTTINVLCDLKIVVCMHFTSFHTLKWKKNWKTSKKKKKKNMFICCVLV